ncbi:hypothetical protein ECNE1487_1972, partial [Escherichia coli NE1487]
EGGVHHSATSGRSEKET